MTILNVPDTNLFNISISLDKSILSSVASGEDKENNGSNESGELNGISTEIYLVNKRMDQCLGTLKFSLTANAKPSTPVSIPEEPGSPSEEAEKDSNSESSRTKPSDGVRVTVIPKTEDVSINESCQEPGNPNNSDKGKSSEERKKVSQTQDVRRKSSLASVFPTSPEKSAETVHRKLSCGAQVGSSLSIDCNNDLTTPEFRTKGAIALQTESESLVRVSPIVSKAYNGQEEGNLPLRKRSALRPPTNPLPETFQQPEESSPVKLEPNHESDHGVTYESEPRASSTESAENEFMAKRKRKISIFQGRPTMINWDPQARRLRRSPSPGSSSDQDQGPESHDYPHRDRNHLDDDEDDDDFDEEHGHYKTIVKSPTLIQGSSSYHDDAKRKCSLFNSDLNCQQLTPVPGSDDYYRKISALSLGGISFNPEDGFESLDEMEANEKNAVQRKISVVKREPPEIQLPVNMAESRGAMATTFDRATAITGVIHSQKESVIQTNFNMRSSEVLPINAVTAAAVMNGAAAIQNIVNPAAAVFLQGQHQGGHLQAAQQQTPPQSRQSLAIPSFHPHPHPAVSTQQVARPPIQAPFSIPPLLHVSQTIAPQSISPHSMYSSDSSPVSSSSFNIHEGGSRGSLTPPPQSSSSVSRNPGGGSLGSPQISRTSGSGSGVGSGSRSVNTSGATGRMAQCDLCPYQAKHPYQIKLHKRNCHSDERPYQCNYCWYASKQRCNLNRHIRQVHRHATSFSSIAQQNASPGTSSSSRTGSAPSLNNFANSSSLTERNIRAVAKP